MKRLTDEFMGLYCDETLFHTLSTLHPISFRRILPFDDNDRFVDEEPLLAAEQAHMADRSDTTRQAVVEQYSKHGLVQDDEAINLQLIDDFFDADFFGLMGLVYANEGMHKCALRWYGEQLRETESDQETPPSDGMGVYANVGYSLYALGLFEETIAWSKACFGPRPLSDAICRGLIEHEAQVVGGGGKIQHTERAGDFALYTVEVAEPQPMSESTPYLKDTLQSLAPSQEVFINLIESGADPSLTETHGYPFRNEMGNFVSQIHLMNLIFASCALADDLIDRGCNGEAKRLLAEAAILETKAGFVRDRIEALSS